MLFLDNALICDYLKFVEFVTKKLNQLLENQLDVKNILMSPEKKLSMVEGLSDCLNYLEESGRCLQFEPGPISGPDGPTQFPSFEYMVRLAAERAKKEVGEFCEVLKML